MTLEGHISNQSVPLNEQFATIFFSFKKRENFAIFKYSNPESPYRMDSMVKHVILLSL